MQKRLSFGILHAENVAELFHTDPATGVTNRLHFFYDTQDKQAMVEYNGVKYSYAYNLQGDVVGCRVMWSASLTVRAIWW